MECKQTKIELEEMMYKMRDPNTTEDELIGILADILVEGFMWQYEHTNELEEQHIPKVRKKKRNETEAHHPDQEWYL